MGSLGLDTSCYTTSVAFAENGAPVAQRRRLLNVKAGERGLRQSQALFEHVTNLPVLVEELMEALDGARVDCICASAKPRPVEGSYMPVFLAGEGIARSLAATLRVPMYRTSHQQGHIRAALQGSGLCADEFIAVHLSGGTTEALRVSGALDIELLGGTLDINAGQLVDRIGVALGLGFPSGPELEKLAVNGVARSILPLSAEGINLHFSGAEAQLNRVISAGETRREDIAAEVYSYISRAIARMIHIASRETGVKRALIAGGVASSALFRRLLSERVSRLGGNEELYWGAPEYSGDNAMGVALIGCEALASEHK